MYTFLILFMLIISFTAVVLNLPVFGKSPTGRRLAKIKAQPLYADGQLQNESVTPTLPEGISYFTILRKVIKGNKKGSPDRALPHLKPDFERSQEFKLIWFGHSSYLIQVEGKNILVDPVFSERPSPIQFIGTKRFPGTDFVDPVNLPLLDIVLITHDHYDHLDYHTIRQLKTKHAHFVTSLGVAEHLILWGIPECHITELAWEEHTSPIHGLNFTALPARHFSGRKFTRNQTLWSSFVLQTEKYRVYLGGDSGYDQHFKRIGDIFGPFDLAILECGQYNEMWPLIHLFPEDVIKAGMELKTDRLLPVHWGKYKLALHDWDEPIRRLVAASEGEEIEVITPMLGEAYYLDRSQATTHWWTNF